MDADAEVEAGVTVGGLHFCAQGFAEIQKREAATHGALGIVLRRAVRAEGGEDVVAGVPQHLATVGSHDRRAPRQRTVHQRADFLGIEVLRQRGRSHHVHEQDADVLEDLGLMLPVRSGTQCREPTAQRPERRIGDGVAQKGSLRLQALDGEFQLLKLRGGHGGKNSNRLRCRAGFVTRRSASCVRPSRRAMAPTGAPGRVTSATVPADN